MPMQALTIQPGVQYQPTPLALGSGWHFTNLVRFKEGQIQKLGGCMHLNGGRFVGTARALHAHVDLSSTNYLAIGTNQRLQLYTNNGVVTDITPILSTKNIAGSNFATTIGSSQVIITDTTTVGVGDWISIVNAMTIGGLLLQGFYQILATGAGNYTIDAGVPALSTSASASDLTYSSTSGSHTVGIATTGYTFVNNSTVTVGISQTFAGITISGPYTVTVAPTATFQAAGSASSTTTRQENSGNAKVNFLIASAIEGRYTSSYGFGPYGAGPYGASQGSVVDTALRVWSLASWGQDLLASPSGGPIYYWVPPISSGNVAVILANAPTHNAGVFVATTQQIAISYGATDPFTNVQDPMLVRWSDIADFNDWTATVTNQAGSFRLPVGSKIVAGLTAPQQGLLWTDRDLWAMQYIGYPFVFGFNRIGWACGAISQRCIAQMGASFIWMSQNGFFSFDGTSVSAVDCPVYNYIFDQFDANYADAVFAAANTYFNEVFFFFPTVGSMGQVTDYVKYNVKEGVWDFGELARSAWVDQSVFGQPIAADYSGSLQQHEVSNDLDGLPMNSFATTGLLGISDGQQIMFVEKCYPDIQVTANSTVYVAFSFFEYEGATPVVKGPYNVGGDTPYIVVRGRGRYMQITVGSSYNGATWRLGKIENLIAPSGRRG